MWLPAPLNGPPLTGGDSPLRRCKVQTHPSRRLYALGRLSKILETTEQATSLAFTFMQSGVTLAALAENASLTYKARQVIKREQEDVQVAEVEEDDVVITSKSLETILAKAHARQANINIHVDAKPDGDEANE